MKRLMLGGAAALLALAVISAGIVLSATGPVKAQQGPDQGPPPAKVVVAEAKRLRMAPVVQMPGTVISPDDSIVAAAISGSVTWIAEVGADVDEGAVIARIDDRDWQLARADAAADVKRLEARLVFLNKDVARVEELAATRNTPMARLDQAIADREATAQDLARARNALKRAEVNIARTQVRAPFPGRVVARRAQVGEFANPGRELVRLVDTRRPEIRLQVPVSLAASLSDGQAVDVIDDARRVPGRIRTIIPVGDAVSRAVEVRVIPDQAAWLIGSAVRVALPSAAPREVVAVPRDALILRAGASYVFVIGEDLTAVRVSVDTGTAEGDYLEVIGEIGPGDRVVIRGGERLRPGQSVELAKAPGVTVSG
ncbi:MAG: efflux RND transporter periplasmic adaptor subunit [Rhodothalassiaceae bacterium]